MFLTGPAAATAWINSIGNLSGFVGPWYVGFMRDTTGSYAGGLYGLALFGFLAAAITAFRLTSPIQPRCRRANQHERQNRRGCTGAAGPLQYPATDAFKRVARS